jgi:cytoskeleton protein RodZ
MSSVGAYLRGLREQQGMSVDELSRATRVLSHYLEALEADDTRRLPAPVFTKGFIRAYCQSVGVSPDEALRLYDRMGVPAPDLSKVPVNAVRVAAVAEAHPRQVMFEEPDYLPVAPGGIPPQGEARDSRSRGTLLISFILLVVLGAAFFAVTLAIQSGRDDAGEQSAQIAQPQLAQTTETPAPSPAPADSLPPQAAAPTQPAKPSPGVGASAATHAAPAPSAPAASPSTAVAPSAQAPAAPVAVAPRPQPAPSIQQAPSVQPSPGVQPAPGAGIAPPAGAPAAVAAQGGAAVVAPGARTASTSGPYRLIARTTETTWMRVRTDDGRTSEETIPANEIREWVSNGPFVITIGNAGGVSLELNGRPVPRLGASGSVITRLVLPSDNQ